MIREASIEDDDSILKLGMLINPQYTKLFSLNKILKDPNAKIMVYEENQNVLGFVHIIELEELIDIINIVVDDNYRKNGIGSKLIEHIINNAQEKVTKITLEVEVNNKAAIKLYEKYNFEILGTREKYYNGIDAYTMGRWIK